MDYTYAYYQESADYILEKAGFAPELAIVLGTCLGPFAERIEERVELDYTEIPHFLRATAIGHAGKLILGKIGGKRVACMSGRFHSYEGYTFEQLALPVRVFKCLGVRAVLLTNAAGAINESYRPGDVMLISDHIKLTGDSPMRGPNIEEFGPRFFDISHMYTPALRALARECAEECGFPLREGVYFFFTGPQYETPAEIRAARVLGGDAAGMSTVTEALTAAHCGLPLLAFSVMVNMAAGVVDTPITQQELDAVAGGVAGPFSDYMQRVIERI